MASKEFKATNGIANWETKQNVITVSITSNSATTIDTVALNSFYSVKYDITIVQGSKVRTSTVSVQTDGTSVDSTEYGIVATGGAISGVAITATTSGSNMLLQVTITDAATTIARVRAIKNLLGVIQPYAPSAPTIGTATAGAEQASITFTPSVDNGLSAITSYIATSNPGNITGSAASSPVLVTGLTGATAYTFIVQAINAYGTSLASATSNSVTPTIIPAKAMYFMGGSTAYPTNYPRLVNKLLASNETMSTLSSQIVEANGRVNSGGLANSGTAGYLAGGQSGTPADLNSIEKMPFATDTLSALVNTLSNKRYGPYTPTNSGTAGYIAAGGYDTGINKILFSSDTISTISATVDQNRYVGGTASNSGVAGYMYGAGQTGIQNKVLKLTFSNETISTPGTMTPSREAQAGFANNGVAGYFAGGLVSGPSYTGAINKIAFSNDALSTMGITLGTTRYGAGASSNSGVAGYIAGGTITTSYYTVVEKLTFSNETISTIGATLSNPAKRYIASFANSGTL